MAFHNEDVLALEGAGSVAFAGNRRKCFSDPFSPSTDCLAVRQKLR